MAMGKLQLMAVLAGALLHATPSWADLILLGGGDPLVFVGVSTGSIVVASFIDTQPGEIPGDFTATIAWGDSSSSGGTVGALGGDAFYVVGTHTYGPNGIAIGDFYQEGNLDIAIADQSSNSASVLLNQPLAATAEQSFSGVVGSFFDSDSSAMASEFSATIDWGDGMTSSGTIVPNGSGGFDIQGTHNYGAPGGYAPTVTLDGPGGSSLNAGTRAAVIIPEPGTLPLIATSIVLLAGAFSARRRPD